MWVNLVLQHVDKEVVYQAGYQSHKEMRKSMFTRAKASEGPSLRILNSESTNSSHHAQCFYDNGCEKDRIIIIQSVSLLAFWYSDLAERTDSWHWMGIAISLCQTLGLNRDPDRGHYNKNLSDRQRQLWRRIWWSKPRPVYPL